MIIVPTHNPLLLASFVVLTMLYEALVYVLEWLCSVSGRPVGSNKAAQRSLTAIKAAPIFMNLGEIEAPNDQSDWFSNSALTDGPTALCVSIQFPVHCSIVAALLKRIVSTLLILLILLNTMGYYFIFWGLEIKNDVHMSQSLDEDYYDESKAVTIRIPIAIPYQYDNPNFVRAEGKFVHEGESYRLIKQKYERDTLTVLCIRDEQDKKIQHALSDFVSTFTDSPADGDLPSTKGIALFTKEYLATATTLETSAFGWVLNLGEYIVPQIVDDLHVMRVAQPPES